MFLTSSLLFHNNSITHAYCKCTQDAGLVGITGDWLTHTVAAGKHHLQIRINYTCIYPAVTHTLKSTD